jgi:PAS domain S-box-containing protein
MAEHSEEENGLEDLRRRIIGLGERSQRKSYFPQLQERIEELEQTNKALRESEKKYRTLVENVSIGIFRTSPMGNEPVIQANPAMAKIFGYDSVDEFLQVHPEDLYRDPHDREALIAILQKDGVVKDYEIWMKRKDGMEIVCSLFFSAITDHDGRIKWIDGVITDITERKKAEEVLRESESRLQLKLNSILSPEAEVDYKDLSSIIDVASLQALMDDHNRITKMPMAIMDLKGKLLVCSGWQDICTKFHRGNEEAKRFCFESDIIVSRNLRPGEIIAYRCKHGLIDVVTPLYIGDKHVANLFTGQFFYNEDEVDEQTFLAQAERYGFDADEYLEALHRVPRFSHEQVDAYMQFLTHLASMISDLSLSNVRSDKARQDLIHSNEELKQFAYVASHDLQEPLRMVVSYLTVLRMKYKDQLDPKAQGYMNYAIEGGERMRALIDDLLVYSRIDGQAKPLAPTDMNQVMESVISILRAPIEESGADIHVGPLPTVMADESQMVQVMQNLLSNAIKFHGAERPVIHVSAARNPEYWTFAVQDNGIGLNVEYAGRIFQMFQRLNPREKYPGTGVGLAIVKKIIERHGGQIWVDSEEGRGSTFFFTLPRGWG